MSRHRENWQLPGEPRASLYTPDWLDGQERIELLPEPERGHYTRFFAHLDAGWQAVRPLQLAAESLLAVDPRHDVALFVDVDISDNFRWLALGCLQTIPEYHTLDAPTLRKAGFRSPYGDEPPIDELIPEAEMLARNVRLLARMERSRGFPPVFLGIVRPAAEAMEQWQRWMATRSHPVIQYVVKRTGG